MIRYKDSNIFVNDSGEAFNGKIRITTPSIRNEITGDEIPISEIINHCYPNGLPTQAPKEQTTTKITPIPKNLSKEEKLQALKQFFNPAKHEIPNPVQRTEHANQEIEHAKQRLAESNGNFKGYYIINHIKYSNARQAAKANNCSPNTIIKRCKQQLDGYKFVPK